MGDWIEFCNVSKSYTGVRALNDISFRAEGGQVCALMGENGAGKSTLLKILSGDIQADEGHIRINGEQKQFNTPNEALLASISVIYQERQLVRTLSVMENVFFEDLPTSGFGVVNRKALAKETQRVIDEFNLPIRPGDRVEDLSVAHQQMVEIMKAYRRNSKIVAFDEPTASLTDTEINTLFAVIGKLKAAGHIVLYVSHRMSEVFQITDQIVVLKDGCFVANVSTKEVSEAQLIRYMVGRDLGDVFSNLKRNERMGEVILRVEHLCNDRIHDVSFELHAGEILGLAGLVGSGRTEVVRAIFGADPLDSGDVYIGEEKARIRNPADAIRNGIGLCPEDRKIEGLVPNRSVRDNITISILDRVSRWGLLDNRKESEIAKDVVKRYNVKTQSIQKIVAELSGGNQQKVIVGRWLSTDSRIFILDEPTKGIDVGAKSEVYQMVCDLAQKGIGVIFISSEMMEVMNVSDTILVMHDGRVTGRLAREDATEEKILTLAMLEKNEG